MCHAGADIVSTGDDDRSSILIVWYAERTGYGIVHQMQSWVGQS